MLTHEEMVGLQAERHKLTRLAQFRSREDYVLHLIHSAAYHHVARLAANMRVLDLGCNTGYGSKILARYASQVVAVDVSPSAIAFAKKQFGHLGIAFQLIDGKQLPFDNQTFDLVVSCQVIEHIVDSDAFLGELKRVLSPTGLAILTTPNAALRLDSGMKPWNRFHVREFQHDELARLLRAYFKPVKILGLRADEPLYAIEAARVNRARLQARSRQSGITPNRMAPARLMFRAVLPPFLTGQLRKLKISASKWLFTLDRSFRARYGVTNLYYRENNLDTALDLLAVCGNDEAYLKNAITSLTESHGKHSVSQQLASGVEGR